MKKALDEYVILAVKKVCYLTRFSAKRPKIGRKLVFPFFGKVTNRGQQITLLSKKFRFGPNTRNIIISYCKIITACKISWYFVDRFKSYDRPNLCSRFQLEVAFMLWIQASCMSIFLNISTSRWNMVVVNVSNYSYINFKSTFCFIFSYDITQPCTEGCKGQNSLCKIREFTK